MYKFCQLFNIYERYQDNVPEQKENSKVIMSTIIKSIYFIEGRCFYDKFYYFFYEEFKLDENLGMNFEVFNEIVNKSINYDQYIVLNNYLLKSLEKRYIFEQYIQIEKNLLSMIEFMKPLQHIKNEVPKEEDKFSYVKKGVMDTDKVNDPSSILHYVTKGDNNKEQGEFNNKTNKKELTNNDLLFIKTMLYSDDMYFNDYENDTLNIEILSETNKEKYYTMKYNLSSKSYFCNCLSYKYSSDKFSNFKCKHLERLDKMLGKVMKNIFRKQ